MQLDSEFQTLPNDVIVFFLFFFKFRLICILKKLLKAHPWTSYINLQLLYFLLQNVKPYPNRNQTVNNRFETVEAKTAKVQYINSLQYN